MKFCTYFIVAFLMLFFFNSCKKKDPILPVGSNMAVNKWIWYSMKHYYFWQDKMPGYRQNEEQPISYFSSLLIAEDHFSALIQNQNTDSYQLSFETSFGFDFIQHQKNSVISSIVTLVVPGSQADEQGLCRGDTLLKINDITLHNNINSSVDKLLKSNLLVLTRKDGKQFSLASAYIARPILYESKIIDVNRHKYGYLYISHFNFAGAYDLIKEVQKFKSEGIQDLILDLRYNPGGQVSFASFCSMLLSKVTPDSEFIKLHGNSKVGRIQKTFSQSLAEQPDGYSFKSQEVKSNSLDFSKIYILSTKQTASSSELLINNLRPYLNVVQVGEVSMGKDMASMSISSPNEVSGPENYKWILQPLVYKLYNSQGKGDYSKGLQPNIVVDEFSGSALYPFGDINDPLLSAIIKQASKSKVRKDLTDKAKRTVLYRRDFSLPMDIDGRSGM
ncbi:S41 family peptidase [Sphingobacterium daejeonense]|uniref:S41 family peptidase n=1 Tax=Sphingobacterium daejeonense TaxID=371142 RepID=UPI003D312EA0